MEIVLEENFGGEAHNKTRAADLTCSVSLNV